MERRPTIYDVAREAGVAASTVSRAYSRPGRVNAETAQQVFEAAERLGYRSDRLDGQQPGDRAAREAIGLVIADVTNPFYGDIIKGAYEAAREAGYQLILLAHQRVAGGRAADHRAGAGPGRRHRHRQLPDDRLGAADGGQAQAGGAAQPDHPGGVLRGQRQRARDPAGRGAPRRARPRADPLRGRAGDQLVRRRALAGVARGGGRARPGRAAHRPERAHRAGRAERRAAGGPGSTRRRCSPTTTRWPSAS